MALVKGWADNDNITKLLPKGALKHIENIFMLPQFVGPLIRPGLLEAWLALR